MVEASTVDGVVHMALRRQNREALRRQAHVRAGGARAPREAAGRRGVTGGSGTLAALLHAVGVGRTDACRVD
ncbi:MAG: hypothetical protein M3220_20415 [Chloroflexota bacterium]|nr:hypothetical protein [Chloroflexota bacterium]